MPWALAKVCPRCRRRKTRGRYCPPCQRDIWQEQERRRPHPELRRLYATARWRRLRRRVLAEEPLCGATLPDGRHCGEATEVVDHKTPAAERPDLFWTRSNLQGLCTPCHNRKTAAEARAPAPGPPVEEEVQR